MILPSPTSPAKRQFRVSGATRRSSSATFWGRPAISGLTPWRPAVVFGFGLLHGLGFAGVLGQLGLPEQERLLGLLSFNVGIELGQLLVIALALASVGLLRHRPWYRARITVPLSVGIAGVGLFWAVERTIAG